MSLKAPFPWFGGKRRVADVVWRAFGSDVPNYVEPFAGSLAVLLGRPGGAGKIATVNDRDRYLANFWRAVTAAPDDVARHADWPVSTRCRRRGPSTRGRLRAATPALTTKTARAREFGSRRIPCR